MKTTEGRSPLPLARVQYRDHCYLFALLLVVLSLCCSGGAIASSPPPTTPPSLSDTFVDPSAVVWFTQQPGSIGTASSLNCSVWSLVDAKSNITLTRLDQLGYAYGLYFNSTSLVTQGGSYTTLNGICRRDVFVINSAPEFARWVPYSSYEGNYNIVQITGRQADTYKWSIDAGNDTLSIYVDTNSSMLIRYELGLNDYNFTSVWDFSPSLRFDISIDASVFAIPEVCTHNYTCPVGGVEYMEVYNFHSVNDFWLNNTNTADVNGDAYFICTSSSTSLASTFQWVSQWQILVNTTWGQYQLCNYGVCLGGDGSLVGREISEGLGLPNGGQCTHSSNGTGYWYSLNGASECDDDENIGDNGCKWKVINRMKTINASCLFENGFFDACKADVNAPYLKAAEVFAMAFLSDDPAEMGCPPIALNATNPNGNSGASINPSSHPAATISSSSFFELLASIHHGR